MAGPFGKERALTTPARPSTRIVGSCYSALFGMDITFQIGIRFSLGIRLRPLPRIHVLESSVLNRNIESSHIQGSRCLQWSIRFLEKLKAWSPSGLRQDVDKAHPTAYTGRASVVTSIMVLYSLAVGLVYPRLGEASPSGPSFGGASYGIGR